MDPLEPGIVVPEPELVVSDEIIGLEHPAVFNEGTELPSTQFNSSLDDTTDMLRKKTIAAVGGPLIEGIVNQQYEPERNKDLHSPAFPDNETIVNVEEIDQGFNGINNRISPRMDPLEPGIVVPEPELVVSDEIIGLEHPAVFDERTELPSTQFNSSLDDATDMLRKKTIAAVGGPLIEGIVNQQYEPERNKDLHSPAFPDNETIVNVEEIDQGFNGINDRISPRMDPLEPGIVVPEPELVVSGDIIVPEQPAAANKLKRQGSPSLLSSDESKKLKKAVIKGRKKDTSYIPRERKIAAVGGPLIEGIVNQQYEPERNKDLHSPAFPDNETIVNVEEIGQNSLDPDMEHHADAAESAAETEGSVLRLNLIQRLLPGEEVSFDDVVRENLLYSKIVKKETVAAKLFYCICSLATKGKISVKQETIGNRIEDIKISKISEGDLMEHVDFTSMNI